LFCSSFYHEHLNPFQNAHGNRVVKALIRPGLTRKLVESMVVLKMMKDTPALIALKN
jgi:hypothetical protein